jgi:hypothetical protein
MVVVESMCVKRGIGILIFLKTWGVNQHFNIASNELIMTVIMNQETADGLPLSNKLIIVEAIVNNQFAGLSQKKTTVPNGNDGANPIIPLHFCVKEIDMPVAKPFVLQWHYSKLCPAGKVYFGLYDNDQLIGVAVYGDPAMRNQKKTWNIDIELRRLCLTDSAPKNSESKFISITLRLLKKKGFKRVLSMADANFGHIGTIYKASNFKYMGRSRGGGTGEVLLDGLAVHGRTLGHQYGTRSFKKLKSLLGDRVTFVKRERKHVYIYDLERPHE